MDEEIQVVDTSFLLNHKEEDVDIEKYDLSSFTTIKEMTEIDEDLLKYNLEEQIKKLNINKTE